MFEKVLASVMGFFGISAFAKDEDGKSKMTDDQRRKLTEKWGEKFVAEFEKDLLEYEKNGKSADGANVQEAQKQLEKEKSQLEKEIKEVKDKVTKLESEKKNFEKKIQKLEKDCTPDSGEEIEIGEKESKTKFKPDMSLAHNKYLDSIFSERPGAAYSGDSTIDTSELKAEFGKYINSEKLEIFKSLLGHTESTNYMSTVVTDKTEIRAQKAHITSVLQQFVPKWTPKGKAKFTPLTIKNYKCKMNVSIIPSDIMEDILGYLYDENLRPQDMPVVKYILYQLVFPKLDEEREIALAIGEYKEVEPDENGNFKASGANEVMDGYVTLLKRFKKKGLSQITWLLDGITLQDTKLVEQIDKAVDEVKPLYKRKKMFVHADPDLVTRYGKAYRKLYPWLKNEDGEKVKIDFSNFSFVPLEGMRGTGVFFITPKENFKHLKSKDPNSTKIYMQEQDYEVKIFAEWWEATGFWIAEAIFAYLPPNEDETEGSSTDSEGDGL